MHLLMLFWAIKLEYLMIPFWLWSEQSSKFPIFWNFTFFPLKLKTDPLNWLMPAVLCLPEKTWGENDECDFLDYSQNIPSPIFSANTAALVHIEIIVGLDWGELTYKSKEIPLLFISFAQCSWAKKSHFFSPPPSVSNQIR